MTSERDAVLRLSAEGRSIRKIAQQLNLSRMKVQRILAAISAEDEDLAAFSAVMADASPTARASFTFDGMDSVELDNPGVDAGKPVLVERFLDADGNSVSMAEIYRGDFADGSVDRGYLDDAMQQIRQAGYQQSTGIDGRWHWIAPAR